MVTLLFLHVQMITGAGLLVAIYPFRKTKLVGQLLVLYMVASILPYSSAEHHD